MLNVHTVCTYITELVLSMYVKLCVCVCVWVWVWERERERERERENTFQLMYVFLFFYFCCVCCTFWCLDDRGRGLPYKALWLPHSNSDAVCFPWWVWTKPKLGTVWLWMEHYYLSWSALCGSPLPLSSGIKMCNKHLQQKKRNIMLNKCVLSLSLSHPHTHTAWHTCSG